jgi:hypothetical protein
MFQNNECDGEKAFDSKSYNYDHPRKCPLASAHDHPHSGQKTHCQIMYADVYCVEFKKFEIDLKIPKKEFEI